jgi:hypothetical protein
MLASACLPSLALDRAREYIMLRYTRSSSRVRSREPRREESDVVVIRLMCVGLFGPSPHDRAKPGPGVAHVGRMLPRQTVRTWPTLASKSQLTV